MGWDAMIREHVTYMQAAGLRAQTIKTRSSYLRRAARELPPVERVTTSHLLSWLAGHDWKPETRKSARGALVGFFRWAVDYQDLPADPSRKLPAVRVPRAAPRPAPTRVVIRALLLASERDQLLIMLAAYAGLRRSEIARLRWEDVQPGSLRVRGKGGAVRVVPLSDDLEHALINERERRAAGVVGDGWRYQVDSASPYVFPGTRGGHIHPDTVGPLLAELLGEGWTGHTLRHRFATRAYAGTRDLRAVQELLGHSKPETTARYVQVNAEQLRAAVDSAAA